MNDPRALPPELATAHAASAIPHESATLHVSGEAA